MQALLVALGWQHSDFGARFSERGIIFIDANDADLSARLISVLSSLFQPGMKECRVVDASVLNWDMLEVFGMEADGFLDQAAGARELRQQIGEVGRIGSSISATTFP